MKKILNNRNGYILLIVFIMLVITSCKSTGRKSLKPSTDWSRGISLATDTIGTVDLAVGGANQNMVYLVYPKLSDQGVQVHFTQLDNSSLRTVDADLELQSDQIRAPRLAVMENEQIHLFWLARPSGGGNWDLLHVIINNDGTLAGAIRRISNDETNVGTYALSQNLDGGVSVLWDDRDAGGIFGASLAQSGEYLSEPLLLSSSGQLPAIRSGSNGQLHLLWLEGDQIFYSLLEPKNFRSVKGTKVAQTASGTGIVVRGLALGLSEDWVYVFWSISNFSGLEAGTSYTEFVAFQPQDPLESLTSSERIAISVSNEPLYSDYQGKFSIEQMVLSRDAKFGSDFIEQPAPAQAERQELAVALAVFLQDRQERIMQIVVALFEDGQYKGYGIASKTTSLSTNPALAVDGAGNLHVVWQEGSGTRGVFYATTSASAQANLDKLEFDDVANAVLEGSFDAAASMLFFPVFGLGWLLPGLLILIAWKSIRDYETLEDSTSQFILGGAFVIYQAVKLTTLPTILTFQPFSVWIYYPTTWNVPIQWVVPLMILVMAILAANRIKRKFPRSTLAYYMALASTDALLTLAIYGVSFLSAG